jgi:hypothetical protein
MGRLSVPIALFLVTGLLEASDSEWILARSPRFEVYSHAGGSEARQVLLWFERLHSFFEQQTGVRVDRRLPLHVLVFSSIQEYAPFRRNATAEAYYTANDRGDYIILPGPDADRLAAHEYWHFVAHTGALRMPLWLNEGLAEFYSTVRLEATGGRIGSAPRLHIASLRNRFWIRLPVLLTLADNSPVLRERETAEIYYAESWALTHMLKLSPAYAPRFSQLLQRLASGLPSEQALEAVYLRPLDSIASDLRIWFLKDRSAPVPPIMTADPTSIELSKVPSATVHTLLSAVANTANMLD